MSLIGFFFHVSVLKDSVMLSGKLGGRRGKCVPQLEHLPQIRQHQGMWDEMRGCGKWGWLMLFSVPLLSSLICLLPLLLFCHCTQTHKKALSLSLLPVIFYCQTMPSSPSWSCSHRRFTFQTQKRGIR